VEYGVDMNESQAGPKVRLKPFAWWWLGGLVMIEIAGLVIGLFDQSTELVPAHDGTHGFCFVAAALVTLASVLVAFFQSSGRLWARAVIVFVTFAGFSIIGTITLASNLSDIVWMSIDFPPGKTQTNTARLLISRAYQTHDKGAAGLSRSCPSGRT
jgi:hypothetical protein